MTAWLHSPVLLVINALAAYRLVRLWTRDSLPPLPWLRETLADRLNRGRDTEHPLVNLIDCPWCVGFHACWSVMLLQTFIGNIWQWVAVPLALSVAVGFLAQRDE